MHKGTPSTITNDLDIKDLRIAIVVSRFNESITTKLWQGCLNTLLSHGMDNQYIETLWCPGAFEIPFVAKQAALTGKFDAIICLGAVIRGDTPHFDYVCSEAASGIAQVGMETNVPTIFGVLTTDNLEQASDRVGGKAGHKGDEAANAAIEMINLVHSISLIPENISSLMSNSQKIQK